MKRFIFLLILLFLPFASAEVHMAYFYTDNCETCEKLQPFIDELNNISYVIVHSYKVTFSTHPTYNDKILRNLSYSYNSPYDVPILFLGNKWFYFNESNFEMEKKKVNESLQRVMEFYIDNPIRHGKLVYPKPVCILVIFNSSRNESIETVVKALKENITFIKINEVDIKYKENRSMVKELPYNTTPVVFIGENHFYLNNASLCYIVEEAEKYEIVGIDFPDEYGKKRICILFFYTAGCPPCEKIRAKIEYMEKIYPLDVKKYDINKQKNRELLLEYCAQYNVTPDSSNIFIGEKYFHSEDQLDELEKEIRRWLNTGLDCPELEGRSGVKIAEELLKGYTIPVVIVYGLLDGINPCAFATLIFFIAYLERAKRKAILPVGISFAVGVYICYFLIGVGLLEFVSVIRILISFYLDIAIGSIAIILGVFSISDFFIIRKGGGALLQLPTFIKKRRGRIIRKITEDKRILILSTFSFIAGFAISALEFACTGQIYAPIITVIQGSSSLKVVALIYLIIYNVMFILPLLIILSLFYFGYSSKVLGESHKRSYVYVKLFIGIFLLLLGSLMLYHVLG